VRCSARSPGKQACPRRTLVPCHVHGLFRSVLWLPFGAKPQWAHFTGESETGQVERRRVHSDWWLPGDVRLGTRPHFWLNTPLPNFVRQPYMPAKQRCIIPFSDRFPTPFSKPVFYAPRTFNCLVSTACPKTTRRGANRRKPRSSDRRMQNLGIL
jgi:hypothetical protein